MSEYDFSTVIEHQLRERNAALRHQVEALSAALEPFVWTLRDSDTDLDDEDEVALIVLVSELRRARATLARYGGECETCEYSQLNPDGGHCYMFKEKPVRQCAQWQQARYGGGGEEEA